MANTLPATVALLLAARSVLAAEPAPPAPAPAPAPADDGWGEWDEEVLAALADEVVVVTASRVAEPKLLAPATVYVVTAEEIRRYGLRDLRDVLRLVPGLEWSWQHFWLIGGQRGLLGNFSQTLLLVDGREVGNLIAGEAFISYQFQNHAVRRVEVVMGPTSVLYGPNAYAGVINVVTDTDDPAWDGGAVRARAGSHGTSALGFSFGRRLGDDARVAASADLFATDGEDLTPWLDDPDFRPADTYLAPGSNPSFPYRNEARSVRASSRLEWRGLHAGSETLVNRSRAGIEVPEDAFSLRSSHREEHLLFLGWRGGGEALGGAWQARAEARGHWEHIRDQYPAGGVGKSDEGSLTPEDLALLEQSEFFGIDGGVRYRLEADASLRWPGLGNRLLVGAGAELVDVRGLSRSVTSPYPPARNDDPDGSHVFRGEDAELARYLKGGVFVQDQQTLLRRLHLTAGVRVDAHQRYDEVPVSPRLGLVWLPSSLTALRVVAGQAFREPTPFELGEAYDPATGGRAPLQPAKVRTLELAWDQRTPWGLRGQVAAYVNLAFDSIREEARIPGKGRILRNTGEHLTRGIEARLDLDVGRLQGFAAYALTDADPVEVAGRKVSNLDVPPHRAWLGASLDLPEGCWVSGTWTWMRGPQTHVLDAAATDQVERLPDYQRVDVTLGSDGWDLGPAGGRLAPSVSVENVLNRDNYLPNYRAPNPTRFVQEHRGVFVELRLSY